MKGTGVQHRMLSEITQREIDTHIGYYHMWNRKAQSQKLTPGT